MTDNVNGQIVAYNADRVLLRDIAMELNHHHSSIDVFLKKYNENGNYRKKAGGRKTKITASDVNGVQQNIKWS